MLCEILLANLMIFLLRFTTGMLNVLFRYSRCSIAQETLCIRTLIDRFGRFVRHYLVVLDVVCQSEEISAMHGENGAKANIPAIIAAHESVLQSILEKCFLVSWHLNLLRFLLPKNYFTIVLVCLGAGHCGNHFLK